MIGRDHHMQAVETSGRDKPRHGVSAALDQHAAHAARGERGENRRRGDLPFDRGQGDDLDAGRRRSAVPFSVINRRRTPSSANILALAPSRPFGSMTARAG